MAKFVIAGSCNCPYFAKLELLACHLSVNLPHFDVHKIVLPADKWSSWLSEVCKKNGWSHNKSPIVWRELVERGGKGYFLGGLNEFCEYAKCYYGVESLMMTDLMLSIKDETSITCSNNIEEEKYFQSLSKPIHICIVNAISPVAYHLIPQIASGNVFGLDVEVSIRLLDSESNIAQLKGVVMETQDLAFTLLRNIIVCTNLNDAMQDASVVIFLEDNDSPEADESRQEFLLNNAERFQTYAKVLDEVALPNAKVIVAGSGPINFSCFILLENTKELKQENIIASPRLQDRRARGMLSRWLKVNSDNIKDMLILGNCSNNAPEDSILVINHMSRVHNHDGAIWGPKWYSRPLIDLVYDHDWLCNQFVTAHRNHDMNLTKSFKHSAAISEAASLASLLQDWCNPCANKDVTSLGVKCNGSYSISDCVFSLPVRFIDGAYQIDEGIILDNETKQKMKSMEACLKQDLKIAFPSKYEQSLPEFKDNSLLSNTTSNLVQSGKSKSGLSVIPEEVVVETQFTGETAPTESVRTEKEEEEIKEAPNNVDPKTRPQESVIDSISIEKSAEEETDIDKTNFS